MTNDLPFVLILIVASMGIILFGLYEYYNSPKEEPTLSTEDKFCTENVIDSQDYAWVRKCSPVKSEMRCPYNKRFYYNTSDSCETYYLSTRGWEIKHSKPV